MQSLISSPCSLSESETEITCNKQLRIISSTKLLIATWCCFAQYSSVWRLPFCCQRGGYRQHGHRAANAGERLNTLLIDPSFNILLVMHRWLSATAVYAESSSWFERRKTHLHSPVHPISASLHFYQGQVMPLTTRTWVSVHCYILNPLKPEI